MHTFIHTYAHFHTHIATKAQDNGDADRDFLSRSPSAEERERLLQRFRSGFVNLALPMLAFSQPVPAEVFSVTLNPDSIDSNPKERLGYDSGRNEFEEEVIDDDDFEELTSSVGTASQKNIRKLLRVKKNAEFNMWDVIKVRTVYTYRVYMHIYKVCMDIYSVSIYSSPLTL